MLYPLLRVWCYLKTTPKIFEATLREDFWRALPPPAEGPAGWYSPQFILNPHTL